MDLIQKDDYPAYSCAISYGFLVKLIFNLMYWHFHPREACLSQGVFLGGKSLGCIFILDKDVVLDKNAAESFSSSSMFIPMQRHKLLEEGSYISCFNCLMYLFTEDDVDEDKKEKETLSLRQKVSNRTLLVTIPLLLINVQW